MTELLLFRHGETDYNRELRFQGHADPPLNATGRTQAERLAQRLAATPSDRLFTSDLLRARQTAEPLAAAWGLPAEPLPTLREQAFGVLEGLDATTIQARFPGLWARWLAHDPDDAPPGGESTRAFHGRVVEAVRALAEAHPGRRLAVMTHGGVLDMLWRHVHGQTLAARRSCAIPNTGINRLRWRDGRLEIEVWGDAAHLDGLPPPHGALLR